MGQADDMRLGANDTKRLLQPQIDKLTAENESLRAALSELLNLCFTMGDFKNGVSHQGIDEGEVFASGVFDNAQAALADTGNH